MKKTILLLTALLLCVSAVGASALTMTGLDTEPIGRKWEESLFFPRMQALTGVEMTASAYSSGEEYEKMLAGMQQGSIPADVLFKANLSREQEYALMESGALIDLAPLIDEHMPNLSALLAQHPQWREIIALDDGRIASLPLLNTDERQVMVFINTAWLKKLGLPMPQNLDELTQVLQAFAQDDPNGNGKADEIPLDLIGVYEMRWLLPYFGVVADDYHVARSETGEIVFAPTLPGYRMFIEQMHAWYEMGLFGEEAFTGVHSTAVLQSGEENEPVVSGLIVAMVPYTNVPVEAAQQYEPLLMAGPDGSVRWRDMLGEVWTGGFAVTSACEDPAAALRWMDALYGEEGAILAYAGEEGVDYRLDEDGFWTFIVTPGRDVNQIRSDVLMYTGTTMPGLSPSAFLMSVGSEIDQHILAGNAKVNAVSTQVTPAYALSRENQKRADEIAPVLGAAVDIGIARFVTGEAEINDETYTAWLEELDAAGSGELTALYQGM